MAPMTRARAGSERIANDLVARYYCQRASASLIISEGAFPSSMAAGWVHAPGIYADAMTNAWKPVVGAIHEAGGRIFCQLWHTGRASHSDFHDGRLPVAPSAIRHTSNKLPTPRSNGEELEHETPRPLETNEVADVVDEFRDGARRAKEAGFDGVELHAANGYLVERFANGWPLAEEASKEVWYSFDEEGDTDWPAYHEQREKASAV